MSTDSDRRLDEVSRCQTLPSFVSMQSRSVLQSLASSLVLSRLDMVTRHLASWQMCRSSYVITTPVSDERCRLTHLFVIEVQWRRQTFFSGGAISPFPSILPFSFPAPSFPSLRSRTLPFLPLSAPPLPLSLGPFPPLPFLDVGPFKSGRGSGVAL